MAYEQFPVNPTRRTRSILRSTTPLVKAYGLAYASTTAPRLVNLLLHIPKRQLDLGQVISSIFLILRGSVALRRFPTFCAALVGGSTFLQRPIGSLYHYICLRLILQNSKRWTAQRLRIPISRFLAALISAWISLALLNLPKKGASTPGPSIVPDRLPDEASAVALAAKDGPLVISSAAPTMSGKTIDLTLFAVTRAMETAVIYMWRSQSSKTVAARSALATKLAHHTDTLLFSASCGTIMWSWFYHPERLPPTYDRWIRSIAQVDKRLVEVLRLAHNGRFAYGEDRGPEARVLQDMCKEYDWPEVWGDPEQTHCLPCEIVHMGAGPNCHWHAVVRFTRAFKFAMATNLPLQVLAKLIAKRRLSPKDLAQVLTDSARSSAFLGAFVSLMYYGICLSRTRVGPKLFSEKTISQQQWDSGLCVRVACILCGWSVLIEKARRRGELAMFVAPRALATVLPRRYDQQYFWRERAAFAVSTAIVFTAAQEKGLVRGVMGKVLGVVLN